MLERLGEAKNQEGTPFLLGIGEYVRKVDEPVIFRDQKLEGVVLNVH